MGGFSMFVAVLTFVTLGSTYLQVCQHDFLKLLIYMVRVF